jgi:hypothetical protein
MFKLLAIELIRLTIKLVKDFLSEPPPPPPDKKKRDSSKIEKAPPLSLQKESLPALEQKSKGNSMNVYQGRGKSVTDPVDLEAGVYRVDYEFPETSNISVRIVNLKTGKEGSFIYESGKGATTYHLEEKGRFVFRINDWDKKLNWKFAFKRLE